MNHQGHHNHLHHVSPHTTVTTTPLSSPSNHHSANHHHPSTETSTTFLHQTTTESGAHPPHHDHGHHHGVDLQSHQHHGNGLGPPTLHSGHMDHQGHAGAGGHNMEHAAPVLKWVKEVNVLFEPWTTSTVLELVLAMVAAAILAAAYDVIRNYLSNWDNKHVTLDKIPTWRRACLRFYRSFMHALTAAIGYIQMLFAMTYDLRIFVAIILGSGIGYFILGPFFRRLKSERKEMTARQILSHQEESFVVNESQEVVQSLLEEQTRGEDVSEPADARKSVIVLDESALRQLVNMRDTVV